MSLPMTVSGPTIRVGNRRIPLPRSRAVRTVLGSGFVVVGVLGLPFPIVGLWMIGPGLMVLSHDSHRLRRLRRRGEVWGFRKMRGLRRCLRTQAKGGIQPSV